MSAVSHGELHFDVEARRLAPVDERSAQPVMDVGRIDITDGIRAPIVYLFLLVAPRHLYTRREA